MSGPLFVCAAVVNVDVSVLVDWMTTLTFTFGCAFSYSATCPLSQLLAPGASLSAQYQYVRFALLGSSPADLVVFDAAPAANTAAPRTSATPRTATTCFRAMLPPLFAQ